MKLSSMNNIEHPNLVADDALMFDTGALHGPVAKDMQPLTDEETVDFDIVTIRESTRHRCWPRGVVVTFLTAGVDELNRLEVR